VKWTQQYMHNILLRCQIDTMQNGMRFVACALMFFIGAGCDDTHFNLNRNVELLLQTPASFQTGFVFESIGPDELAGAEAATSITFLTERNAAYVQFVVPWYQEMYYHHDLAPSPEKTPTDAALIEAIRVARSVGLKIFLTPRIEVENAHRMLIDPWEVDDWFEDYTKFILHYAEIAADKHVEMLSIGSVMPGVSRHAEHWRTLIEKVRAEYHGDITYGANWDEYQLVEFWDALDYIGLEAFFPLTSNYDPTYEDLMRGWAKWMWHMHRYFDAQKRPVIITGVGFASQDGTNMQPAETWISGRVDLDEQTLCYKSFFESFIGYPWLYGIYMHGWNAKLIGGAEDMSHTPRHKPADSFVTDYFGALNSYAGE
jgi:hypothetical protein